MNITTPEEDLTQAELLYQQALLCLESLDTEDEKVLFEDETNESITEFMGSLTTAQFNDIMKYIEAMPALSHDVEFECTGCSEINTYKLRGMQDFF